MNNHNKPVAVWELFEDGWDSIADPRWMESLPVGTKLYTRPQPAAWVGLTDEELKPLCDVNYIIFGAYTIDFVRAIEAKLKEKNT